MGTRGVADGVLNVADTIALPARVPFNLINGWAGGDPNYFKPPAGTVPDALGLPRPETPFENLAYQANSGLASMLATYGLGSLIGFGPTVAAAPTATQVIGKALTANPGAQAVSATASGVALGAAQNAGAGPVGQFAAATLAGMATPGGGAKGTAARIQTEAATAGPTLRAFTPKPISLPRNPNNPERGTLTLEIDPNTRRIARMSPEEAIATEALQDLGYHATKKAESNIPEIKTADFNVEGLGSHIEVYSPKNITPDSVVRNIERKRKQADKFMIQVDLPAETMDEVARRVWGKPSTRHIDILLFQQSTKQIFIYKRN